MSSAKKDREEREDDDEIEMEHMKANNVTDLVNATRKIQVNLKDFEA